MASTAFTNGVTLTEAAWFNDVDTAAYSYLTSVAGTNTITATGPVSLTAYAAGQIFRFIPANTNTGATTLNISSLGAKDVFFNGAACVGGELRASIPVVVVYDGTQFNIIGSSRAPTIQKFTSSGTWTKPNGLRCAIAEVLGGGGGGGGAAAPGATEASAGEGGWAGGYSRKLIAASLLGDTETVTIGAGGAGGTAGANAGSAGGTTSFGAHCSATGGPGGAAGVATAAVKPTSSGGGTLGVGSGGDVNVAGESGAAGWAVGPSNLGMGGEGGSSYFGGGGPARTNNSGTTAVTPGAGGSGGASNNNGTAFAGGDGFKGIVIVTEFY